MITVLLVARHFRFRRDDVDRRHRADFDAGLVVLERGARDVERLLRDVEAGDRADQVVVGGAHAARGLRQALLQLEIRRLRLVLAQRSCCRFASILKLRSSGWVIVGVETRAELRIEDSC